MFKRRDSRPWWRLAREMVWPQSGWKRAGIYTMHRLRRLPDSPERIARGVFAGVFISFTPLFGFHFIGAAAIALAIRGNIAAALIGTFVGNPLTTPFFMTLSLETGYRMLGAANPLPLSEVLPFFAEASARIARNLLSFWTGGDTDWTPLREFFTRIWLPMLAGSVVPGTIAGLICQFASLPLIRAWQRLRNRSTAARLAASRARPTGESAEAPARPAAPVHSSDPPDHDRASSP